MAMQTRSKMLKKAFYYGIPLYDTDFCRILVSGDYIWDLYECVGVQFLVSNADEYYHICRLH